MRLVLLCSAAFLYGSVCFGQADSSKTLQQPTQKQVFIPGIDTPTSGPGMNAQMPATTPPPLEDGKKRKTLPPSDPRSFGISVPIGKAKKDTLRN
ncbi:hypothetical protein GCM10028807_48940 [Spirosoma daeguense]